MDGDVQLAGILTTIGTQNAGGAITVEDNKILKVQERGGGTMPNKIAGITRCEERKVNIVVKSEECPKHPGHKHSLIISINNNEGPTTRVDSECECGPSRLWSVLSKQNLIEATIALLMEKLEEFLAQLEPIATIAPVSEADDPGDPNSLDFPALTDALDSARRVREALELVLERITGDDET